MKTHLKKVIALFSLIMLLTTGSTLFAQTDDYTPIMKQLTLQQKDMLETQRLLMLKTREQLKTTLTNEQLAILQDKTQTKEQIKLRLRETFTDAQKQMVQSQEGQLSQIREQFRQSLTQEQRQVLQEHMQQTRQLSGQGEMKNSEGFGGSGDKTRNIDGTRTGNGNRGN